LKYKSITYDPEPSTIGVKNGVSQLEFYDHFISEHKNSKKIEEYLIKSDIDFFLNNEQTAKEIDLTGLKGRLYPLANETDLIVFSPMMWGYNYIVSQNFIDSLNEVQVSDEDYTIYTVDIENAENRNYYLLFIPIIPSNEVDYVNSILYKRLRSNASEKKYITISNFQEYNDLLDDYPFYDFTQLALPSTYKSKHILNIQNHVDLFLSDELIDSLQSKNVTNLVIKKHPKLVIQDHSL